MAIFQNTFWWLFPWLVFWIFILPIYLNYLENSIGVLQKTSSEIGQSVDLIRHVMKSNNYGLCDVCIYKKREVWIHIYLLHKCKNYSLYLLGNFEIANIITPHITQLTNLLSEIACQLLEAIKIDFNFIEVRDQFRFDTELKKFIRNTKRLKRSPRAHVRYTYRKDKTPNPKLFIEDMDSIF